MFLFVSLWTLRFILLFETVWIFLRERVNGEKDEWRGNRDGMAGSEKRNTFQTEWRYDKNAQPFKVLSLRFWEKLTATHFYTSPSFLKLNSYQFLVFILFSWMGGLEDGIIAALMLTWTTEE